MTTGLLITTAGQNAIIADLGGGADLVLTHVAWGDANGVPYNPNEAQVVLVNEKYRATIASVAVVAGAIVVDAVIPADTNDGTGRPSHGFNVAEVGLFSAAGTLIGLARCGNGYKPPPSSGQASAVTYRLKLAVANPSAITVVIDPVAQVNVGRHARPFWMAVDGVLNDPPGAPVAGATYVIGAAPTGAWAGFANRLAQWVGVWALATAPTGHVVCDNSQAEDSSSRFMRRTAAGWVSAAASASAYGPTLMATPAEAVAAASTTKVPNVDAMSEALQAGRLTYAVAGGTANAWTVAPNRAISAYSTGRILWVRAPATNTLTAVTVNVSGVGAKPLKKADGTDPAIGDLLVGVWYPTIDDGAAIRVVKNLPSDMLAAASASPKPPQLNFFDLTTQNTQNVGSSVVTVVTDFAITASKASDAVFSAGGTITIGPNTAGEWVFSQTYVPGQVSGSASTVQAYLQKNGNSIQNQTVSGTFCTNSGSVKVAAGDTLRMAVWQNSGFSQKNQHPSALPLTTTFNLSQISS